MEKKGDNEEAEMPEKKNGVEYIFQILVENNLEHRILLLASQV